MSSLKNNAFVKVLVIGGIILLLLIPALILGGMISDRQNNQSQTVDEITDSWAARQFLLGPFLSIPYYEISLDGKSKTLHHLHVMPNNLTINGNLKTQTLHRGIYDAVVYDSEIQINGDFTITDLQGISPESLLLERAVLTVGISDLRGIQEQVDVQLGDTSYRFEAGVVNDDVASSGIHTVVTLPDSLSKQLPFAMKLSLKGADCLEIAPIGIETKVILNSDWTDPSFMGNFLPVERTVSDSGSYALWKVLNLNRNLPYSWKDGEQKENAECSNFGVQLLLPVDGYQKTERCLKYSFLFTLITFITFFFVEILKKRLVHPIQYLLVGVSLIVFYTLLLSLSEYIAFNLAYLIAAVATILLIGCYSKAILKSSPLALLVGGILTILYGFMFTIIQLQDYALLVGSISVFVVLCIVMFLSRKVDWYNINGTPKENQ